LLEITFLIIDFLKLDCYYIPFIMLSYALFKTLGTALIKCGLEVMKSSFIFKIFPP